MDDIYKSIEEYFPNKKYKILIKFDDMIADMLSKKISTNSNRIIIEGRKPNISVFIT